MFSAYEIPVFLQIYTLSHIATLEFLWKTNKGWVKKVTVSKVWYLETKIMNYGPDFLK